MNQELYLGVARKNATPKVGGHLMGYALDVFSESVNDDLTVTAFYFRQGKTHALMISATVCIISIGITERILSEIEKQFGIPHDCCILHATHTHSGPNLGEQVGWGDYDREYLDNIFLPAIMAAVGEAIEVCEPVTMAVAVGESLIGCNRRELTVENKIILGQNPWGPFDPKMTVISFKNASGKPTATIVHYGAHQTASGRNHEITRDWSGPMIDTLDNTFGGISAFFNGPEGDTGPRMPNGRTTGGFVNGEYVSHVRYAMQIGSVAAQDATRIYKQLGGYHSADLSVSKTELKIPLSPRLPLEVAKERYEEFKRETTNLKGAKANYYRNIIDSYENGYEEKPYRELNQTVIRVGEVAFVTFTYELFSEIGMRIARASSIPHTLSLSNANGSSGYFPTESELCRGGYEVEMFRTSFIQPYVDNADFHIVTQTLEHLKKV